MSKHNEPAFPNITPDMCVDGGPGLTKREWFAGMALQGILANPNTGIYSENFSFAITKANAEYMADAMLEEGGEG
jgi:hypothetical protein